MKFTLVVPYYRNPAMLERQISEWLKYPPSFPIILVDDGSPEPAEALCRKAYAKGVPLKLLRVTKDIPWNRNGARNLGTMEADTHWVVHVDIDHIMPAETVRAFDHFTPQPGHWYRFSRYRVGKADFTRKKDEIPDDVEFGKIKPHMDSYLIERQQYLDLGGYDEDYSGSLGGGTPFVKELDAKLRRVDLPEPYTLHVHTTYSVRDASDIHLSRSHDRYTMINRTKKARPQKKPMCQFEWENVAL